MPHLRTLCLDFNFLTSLPDVAFTALKDLTVLKCQHNKLSQLPQSLFLNCSNLKQLCLSSNLIKRVPSEVGLLTCLEELKLDRNPIVDLPSSVQSLKNLRLLTIDWTDYLQDSFLPDLMFLASKSPYPVLSFVQLLLFSCE